MLASAGLGILGFKSPHDLDGFGWFRMVSDVQKALATDRRQRRHELSRETLPGGKIPRISPSWAAGQRMGRFGDPEEWAGGICDYPEPTFLELLCVSRVKKTITS